MRYRGLPCMHMQSKSGGRRSAFSSCTLLQGRTRHERIGGRMVDLSVRVGNVDFQNPVILASGTCGFGRELSEYFDFTGIGGICSKGLTLLPREGNPGCRVAETASGMLNSVGLQNPGLD